MPALCPSPERVPEEHPHFSERRTCFDVTVIVCPALDDRIEQTYQILLLCGSIRSNRATHLFQEGVHVLFGGCNQELVAISPQVLPQEVEALFDMRDTGLLRRELQATFGHEPFDQWLDFILQQLFRAASDDEVIGIAHEVHFRVIGLPADFLPAEGLLQQPL